MDYNDEGQQIITKTHDEVPVSQIVDKVMRAINEGVTRSVSGKDVPIAADSVCVHSDTPNAVEVVRSLRQAIDEKFAE